MKERKRFKPVVFHFGCTVASFGGHSDVQAEPRLNSPDSLGAGPSIHHLHTEQNSPEDSNLVAEMNKELFVFQN